MEEERWDSCNKLTSEIPRHGNVLETLQLEVVSEHESQPVVLGLW